MQITIKHLLAVLVGVALAFLMPMDVEISKKRNPKRGKAGAATVRVGGNWAKIRYLREHLQNAIQIAPVAAGGGFMEEPNVRVGKRDEVAGILRTDFDAAFRAMGAKDDATVAGMAQAFAERLPAIYDPAENMIHVIPENAVEAAARADDESLLDDGVLKLLLVRMAVIALDRQLYPEWKEALDAAKDRDALNAAMAILQGHAQYATERVVTAAHAQEWKNLKPDFDKLVALLIAEGPPHPLKDGMDADIKFAILKGHAYMKLLAKKKGQGGVQRNMK